MALTQNQFQQSVVQGMHGLRPAAKVLSAQIDTSSAGGLVAGQPVKLVDSAGGVPKVVECSANTDVVFGFIVYDLKKAAHAVGDVVEVDVGFDDIMYMTAGAAIARGALVMIQISGVKVVTATTGKPISGWALDKAAADGDLIRVSLSCPAYFNAP